MKRKTLYIHGLDSSPKEEKISIIKRHSEVFALHLDYKSNIDPFKILDELIVNNGVTDIIGSSMGGYLGYWLSEKNKLPCLLFNPALNSRSVTVEVERFYNQCPKRLVILGENDTVVDPLGTIDFLQTSEHGNIEQEIVLNSKMEHRIDLSDFEKYVRIFFS